MDFENEVLEALAHLDHAPTPPTIVKFSPILPSSKSSTQASRARGGSSDSSDDDMASYNGDSNCHSDEDEDDGRNPVYATRSLVHGVKQPTLIGDVDRSNLSHLAPKISKSKSIASLTEQSLRANKTLLLGKRIKIHFPGYGGSYGEVIEWDVVKDLYKLEFAVDGEVQLHDVRGPTPPTLKPPLLWCRCCRNHSVEGVDYKQPTE